MHEINSNTTNSSAGAFMENELSEENNTYQLNFEGLSRERLTESENVTTSFFYNSER